MTTLIFPILAQSFLKNHSLLQLKEEHGVKSSAKVGDRVFSLNYDQIESKPSPLVNQCRGVILSSKEPLREEQILGDDPVGRTDIYARPFDRFFNLGDSNAANVDIDSTFTRFFEKLDGTLCIVWFHPETKKWNVATRAVPYADKPITGWEDLTFRKLFERALAETLFGNGRIVKEADPRLCFDIWSNNLDPKVTYCFELTTPLNRIVVEYKNFGVWLLGMRDISSGEEIDTEELNDLMDCKTLFGVPVCPSYKLNNLPELLSFVGSKPPFEQEGVVVRDGQFNRIKVKSLAYMAYNRLRDSTANSPRAIMELILCEKLDDAMPVLETWMQEKAVKMQEQTKELLRKIDRDFKEVMAEPNLGGERQWNERKWFALKVQARKAWMAPLMDMFLGKSKSMSDWVQSRRNNLGEYSESFLDSMIEMTKSINS